MDWQLRVHNAPLEDSKLFSNTHLKRVTTTYHDSLRGFDTLFCLHGFCPHVTQIHTINRYTFYFSHIYYILMLFPFSISPIFSPPPTSPLNQILPTLSPLRKQQVTQRSTKHRKYTEMRPGICHQTEAGHGHPIVCKGPISRQRSQRELLLPMLGISQNDQTFQP